MVYCGDLGLCPDGLGRIKPCKLCIVPPPAPLDRGRVTNLIILVAAAYAGLLFLVAFVADRQAKGASRARWLNAPFVYTLSLSIYCTAWTFYGSVGFAARSGLEYLTIYLGPTIVMIGWWGLLRRLVHIGRRERITSIADLISSRYGKSRSLGALVTLLATVGIAPYLALQLQSITLSFSLFAEARGNGWDASAQATGAFWTAAGLALFAILFGTRSIDTSERQHGVVLAIAVEGVVKLVALMAVGIFVVWGLAGGVGEVTALIARSDIAQFNQEPDRWLVLTFISATAFLCLPRMFHVLVVESPDDRQLATASWAFPAYLLAMSLFTVPIAVVGLSMLPEGTNPDLFVLSLPLSEGRDGLALLAFLGGFSSATSMGIVATIALATMVSNHIVLPLWLSLTKGRASVSGDVRSALVLSRRIAIVVILGMGYAYYRISSGGAALAAIGLISFAGLSQIAPAMVLGLYWRSASRIGAMAGLATGLVVWLWCMFLPSVGLSVDVINNGPFGLRWLRPQALFGLGGMDPVVHGILWSISLNTAVLVIVSLLTHQDNVERTQITQFLRPEARLAAEEGLPQTLTTDDLLAFSQRIMGSRAALAFFTQEAERQGRNNAEVTPKLLDRLEREMAGSLGTATAHAMLKQVTGGRGTMSPEDLLAFVDETAQVREYSRRLEEKSTEQARTAAELQTANTRLLAQGRQKDAFLSQISHELRTPMTAISSFSDILAAEDLPDEERKRFAGIIRQESGRLTRLLDDLLDLSVLERGEVKLNVQTARLGDVLDRAVSATMGVARGLQIERQGDEAQQITTDLDRLEQVFINLIANAAKYCDAPSPILTITAHPNRVELRDNGSGISPEDQEFIFERFSRLDSGAGGAGLGLAICREVMKRLGGGIRYVPEGVGAGFEVTLSR